MIFPVSGGPFYLHKFMYTNEKVFTAVPIIATVVAVIITPIASFKDLSAGAVANMANIDESSAMKLSGLSSLEAILEDKAPGKITVSTINVTNFENNTPIKNGEEFHIGMDQSITLEFFSPGMDSDNITLDQLLGNSIGFNNYLGSEPGNSFYPYMNFNSILYSMTLDKVNKERFRVTITRTFKGYIEDGKVAFGFRFAHNADVSRNGSIQPIEYKFFDDPPSVRRDALVVNFCSNPDCPYYVD
jgi:hypothetical protein